MTDDLDAARLIVLGRLAGGVAHDFNNQLTSIIGYADLLLEDLAEDAPARADLLEIRRAAERAHLVTTHLLAFNRPRDAEPALISVAATLMSHMHLLKRVLGEDIQIVTVLDREAARHERDLVRADPSQLGQVLLCLGVDARHALPHGGTLTIETSVVSDPPTATSRVRIAMTTARDIPEAEPASDDALRHARSIVEAIVRQAGGEVRFATSSLAETDVTVDLPRVERPAAGEIVRETSPRGIEHVLIVENDMGVRDVMQRTLERHGYTVRVADRPIQALAFVAARPPAAPQPSIDLAIVDLLLPDQRGDVLAGELMALRPGLRVLFISGRGEGDETSAAPAVALRKPFSPHALLMAVRQALDSTPAPARADQR